MIEKGAVPHSTHPEKQGQGIHRPQTSGRLMGPTNPVFSKTGEQPATDTGVPKEAWLMRRTGCHWCASGSSEASHQLPDVQTLAGKVTTELAVEDEAPAEDNRAAMLVGSYGTG